MNSEVPDNWREEMINYTSDENRIRLLREGARTMGEAKILMALRYSYKQIMGIKDPEPPNCQSSFKEWNGKTQSL